MKIYAINIQTVEKVSEEYIKSLMPERWQRAKKYRRRQDQLLCLGAGLLLHQVLGIREQELKYGEYGKPYAEESDKFSISHGGNWSVIAVSPHLVGIDIEPIREENIVVSERVFKEEEISWMRSDKLKRFHILWTIKESIMKADGLGLYLDPLTFSVYPEQEFSTVGGKDWFTDWICMDGCILACCSEKEIEGMEFEEIFGGDFHELYR